MKSRLADLAHVAEIVGAVAVVISLVYVGIQVNDSVGAVRSASANDANVALQNWYMEVGASEQASELFYRGLMSEEPLLDALTAAIVGVNQTPGVHRYWRQRRSYLNESFAVYVDDLLERDAEITMEIYRGREAGR